MRGRRGDGETRGWRTFCAFELPKELQSRISSHIQKVRELVPEVSASWSRPENIHLTVKFFGNVEPQRVARISAAAARVMQSCAPFQIAAGTLGVFPRPSRAQVLWIGVNDPSGKLSALQQQFEAECAREGFLKEDRAFKPHLTIARIRKPHHASRLAEAHLSVEFSSVPLILTELVVFRSELSPNGSKYTPLSRHRER